MLNRISENVFLLIATPMLGPEVIFHGESRLLSAEGVEEEVKKNF